MRPKTRAANTYCVRADGVLAWCGRVLVGNVTAIPVDTFLLSDESMCAACLKALRLARPGCDTARLK